MDKQEILNHIYNTQEQVSQREILLIKYILIILIIFIYNMYKFQFYL